MTALMAGEEQLVFHDFLGIICPVEDAKRRERVSKGQGADSREGEREDGPTRASSLNGGRFEISSDHYFRAKSTNPHHPAKSTNPHHPGTRNTYKSEEDNRQGKRRDTVNSRDSIQEHEQLGIGTLDSPRLLKVSRVDRQDDRKNQHLMLGMDDLHPVMQPPRIASNVLPSSVAKGNLPAKKFENSSHVPNNGALGSSRTSLLGFLGSQTEKVAGSFSRERATMPPLPPADEGSRTGLKGSSVANLLNSGSASPAKVTPYPSLTTSQSRSCSQNVSSDSTFVASKQTTSRTSRQLTIFYGGQAHVFDDVPSDKVDAIMTLAGSSGRSWSTTYSSRPKTSLLSSTGSEGSRAMLDSTQEKRASKLTAMSCFSSLALSSEAHNSIMSTSGVVGQGSSHREHSNLPEVKSDYASFSSKRQDGKEIPLEAASSAGDAGNGLI